MKLVICFIAIFSLYHEHVSAQKSVEVVPHTNKNTILYDDPVEILPHFPGGYQKFQVFLAKNLKYPDSEVQGRVILMFIVEKDGQITHVKVIKSLAPEFDAEAVRVIKLSPKWIPKTADGKPVRSWMSLPINFSLQ